MEVFDFQIPEEAKVIDSEREDKAVELYEHSVELFKQDRFADAIESFRNVRKRYPEFETMKTVSLTWIGKCYYNMGQLDKAIESYKKCIGECRSDSKARIAQAYYLLGFTYMKTAQNAEALEAFENCLDIGGEVRDPDWWTFRQARKYIKYLEDRP